VIFQLKLLRKDKTGQTNRDNYITTVLVQEQVA